MTQQPTTHKPTIGASTTQTSEDVFFDTRVQTQSDQWVEMDASEGQYPNIDADTYHYPALDFRFFKEGQNVCFAHVELDGNSLIAHPPMSEPYQEKMAIGGNSCAFASFDDAMYWFNSRCALMGAKLKREGLIQ